MRDKNLIWACWAVLLSAVIIDALAAHLVCQYVGW
jgi:hypothetical protein